MFLLSSCSRLCPIYWSQVLSWEWRCSWSSADRRCSNYIWVINNLIAYEGVTYIRDFMVIENILMLLLQISIYWCITEHIWSCQCALFVFLSLFLFLAHQCLDNIADILQTTFQMHLLAWKYFNFHKKIWFLRAPLTKSYRPTGDKPLHEPMMATLCDSIWRHTGPEWVKSTSRINIVDYSAVVSWQASMYRRLG